jgi:Na+-driven multidrug efflux pump
MKQKPKSAEKRKGTRWSTQFFIGAAIFGAFTTLEIIVGQKLSKWNPHQIDRVEHLAWYFLPISFGLIGWIFRIYENNKGR